MTSRPTSLTSLWILLGGLGTFVLVMGLAALLMSSDTPFSLEHAIGVVALGLMNLGYLAIFFGIVIAIPVAIIVGVALRHRGKSGSSNSIDGT